MQQATTAGEQFAHQPQVGGFCGALAGEPNAAAAWAGNYTPTAAAPFILQVGSASVVTGNRTGRMSVEVIGANGERTTTEMVPNSDAELPSGWARARSPQGDYYYHELRPGGKVQWERPTALAVGYNAMPGGCDDGWNPWAIGDATGPRSMEVREVAGSTRPPSPGSMHNPRAWLQPSLEPSRPQLERPWPHGPQFCQGPPGPWPSVRDPAFSASSQPPTDAVHHNGLQHPPPFPEGRPGPWPFVRTPAFSASSQPPTDAVHHVGLQHPPPFPQGQPRPWLGPAPSASSQPPIHHAVHQVGLQYQPPNWEAQIAAQQPSPPTAPSYLGASLHPAAQCAQGAECQAWPQPQTLPEPQPRTQSKSPCSSWMAGHGPLAAPLAPAPSHAQVEAFTPLPAAAEHDLSAARMDGVDWMLVYDAGATTTTKGRCTLGDFWVSPRDGRRNKTRPTGGIVEV